MTALDFPSSPASGDSYSKYRWDGEKWIPAHTYVVPPPLEGLSPTGAWSASRKLLSAYGGSYYSLTSSAVSTLNDQSGSARNLTQSTAGLRPTIVSAGPNSRDALQFNGTDSVLRGAAISNFISTSAGYMIATFRATSFPLNSGLSYNNSIILMDDGSNAGISLRSGGGTPGMNAFDWDGGLRQTPTINIAASTVFVGEWRLEGGLLYARVNGSGETSISSGNIGDRTAPLGMGGNFYSSVMSLAGQIFEAAIFSTVPTLAQRNAMVQSFGVYVGASV